MCASIVWSVCMHHTHVCVCVCIVCMWVYVCICLYICVCIHMYVCWMSKERTLTGYILRARIRRPFKASNTSWRKASTNSLLYTASSTRPNTPVTYGPPTSYIILAYYIQDSVCITSVCPSQVCVHHKCYASQVCVHHKCVCITSVCITSVCIMRAYIQWRE